MKARALLFFVLQICRGYFFWQGRISKSVIGDDLALWMHILKNIIGHMYDEQPTPSGGGGGLGDLPFKKGKFDLRRHMDQMSRS